MSYTSRITEQSWKRPVYIFEPHGRLDSDLAADFASATGWNSVGAGANVAVETTDAKGLAGAIIFDKTGTGSVVAGVESTTLEPIDLSACAYETIRIKIPDISVLNSVTIRRGSDASNYWQWVIDDANLAEGWNTVHLSRNEIRSGDTYSGATGSPVETAVDHLYVVVTTNAAGETYSGAIILPPMQCPYRYSTSKVTSAIADTRHGWMDYPTISPSIHDPLTGTLATSVMTCPLVDGDEATIIADLAEFAFLGMQGELKMGFAGDAETADNFQTIFQGRIRGTPSNGRGWNPSVSDVTDYLLGAKVMRDATEAAPVTLTGHPLDIFLALATSTGNGTNGDYDTLTAARGAGVPADYLDISGIETVRDEYRGWATASFTFVEEEPDLLAWFFREVCLAYALAPALTSTGLLTVRVPGASIFPGPSGIATIDGSNIVADRLPEQSPDLELVRNRVRVYYDYDAATDAFASDTGEAYQLAASISRYGLRELAIYSKGINSATVAARVAKSQMYRLGNGMPPIKLELLPGEIARHAGELVELTSNLVADLEGGSYTVAGALCALESRGFSPATHRVATTLGLTTYRAGNYRRIAPSGTANYGSQMDAEKARYASIADGTTKLLDGTDDGHQIGPIP